VEQEIKEQMGAAVPHLKRKINRFPIKIESQKYTGVLELRQ
jgi:hypothetical protein